MAKMKLTKGLVTLDEAKKISPEYVKYCVDKDYDALDSVLPAFESLKKGQEALTYNDGQFVKVKVSSIDTKSFRAAMSDGPIIRVSNGEYSWRVDGCGYAVPIPKAGK